MTQKPLLHQNIFNYCELLLMGLKRYTGKYINVRIYAKKDAMVPTFSFIFHYFIHVRDSQLEFYSFYEKKGLNIFSLYLCYSLKLNNLSALSNTYCVRFQFRDFLWFCVVEEVNSDHMICTSCGQKHASGTERRAQHLCPSPRPLNELVWLRTIKNSRNQTSTF